MAQNAILQILKKDLVVGMAIKSNNQHKALNALRLQMNHPSPPHTFCAIKGLNPFCAIKALCTNCSSIYLGWLFLSLSLQSTAFQVKMLSTTRKCQDARMLEWLGNVACSSLATPHPPHPPPVAPEVLQKLLHDNQQCKHNSPHSWPALALWNILRNQK